jgi:hypothetical protein
MHLSLIGRTYVLADLLQQQPVHYYSQSTAAVKITSHPKERAGPEIFFWMWY